MRETSTEFDFEEHMKEVKEEFESIEAKNGKVGGGINYT